MRKKFLLLGSILLILMLGIVILVVFYNTQDKDTLTEDENKPLEVGEFSLDVLADKYQWYFENLPSDKNIGDITTAEIAAQKAKEFLLEEFNGIDEDDDCFQPKWVRVDYDSKRDCWHVYNTTPKDMVGGVFHVFVYSNGDVISAFVED